MSATARFPLVNLLIVAACTLAYAAVVHLLRFSDATPTEIDQTLDRYALIPARLLALAERGEFISTEFYLPLVSSPFLHVNILHFLPNMALLWLIGDGVEHRFGHLRYAAVYFLGRSSPRWRTSPRIRTAPCRRSARAAASPP